MGRAISIKRLQCEHHLPGTVARQPLVAKRPAGDVAAQGFELVALIDSATHLGMICGESQEDTPAFLLKVFNAHTGTALHSVPASAGTTVCAHESLVQSLLRSYYPLPGRQS